MLNMQTIKEIRDYLNSLDEEAFNRIKKLYEFDDREGVKKLMASTEKRFAVQRSEYERVASLYAFEESLSSLGKDAIIVGLDEVGRGPIAGPLAVGATVLNRYDYIPGLNDSKKLSHSNRAQIAEEIKQKALASAVVYIDPETIDSIGMSACLREAFSRALAQIESTGIHADVVLIDGNPLHIDSREINIIKGDAKCASIAAASIIAKEARDALMVSYAEMYPLYHFESCKGYASAEHIEAIRNYGLCPIHRKSFCLNFTQESLF